MSRLPGGIGAKGSAQAIFFHPSKHIREKWPNNHRKKRVLEVLLVGKGTHHVNQKDQLCYECRIPEINRTVFHICCGKLKIEEAPSTTFEYEIILMAVVADHQDREREQSTALRESVVGVTPNIGGLLQEIAEICHQGIEVDDDKEPAPDNAQPSAPSTQTIGQWVTPTIFPRRENVNCRNTKGVWRQHSWPKFSETTELSIFSMAFPEKWVRDILIPATIE